MVYGVNLERMNCDKLFNLFCLYGNVVKVSYKLQFFDIEEAIATCYSLCEYSRLPDNRRPGLLILEKFSNPTTFIPNLILEKWK